MSGAPGRARRVPANQFKPIIDAAREAWGTPAPGTSTLAPMGCVEGIQLSCAPDLDGAPGSELLAQIVYRTYRTECASPDPNGPSSPTQAIVALWPPRAGSAWKAHGLLGYRAFSALGLEGPPTIETGGFCRLPSGEVAVRARESTDAGDCSSGVVDQLLMLGKQDWLVVASRTINACNEAKEPEETDDF